MMTEESDPSLPALRPEPRCTLTVAQLWEAYFERLLSYTRNRLRHVPPSVTEPEDVVSSVFLSLCRRMASGQQRQLAERDEFWSLLLRLIRCKIADHVRRASAQKRGGLFRRLSFWVRGEESSAEDWAAIEQSPESLLAFEEEFQRLLGLLDDVQTQEIALLKAQGETHEEISAKVQLSLATVMRRVQDIREIWDRELRRFE
jgi:RNA polymerase sigma factor (sigma-70 family)